MNSNTGLTVEFLYLQILATRQEFEYLRQDAEKENR